MPVSEQFWSKYSKVAETPGYRLYQISSAERAER